MSRRSGTLQLTTPIESGEIVFRAGRVIAAYRTNATGTVGDGLLEAGVIAPTAYQEMLAAQKGGQRGPELFTAFNVDQAGLQGALEALLKRLIFHMFDWNEGTFSFVLEDSPDVWRGFSLESMRVVCENGLNPQYLAMEGARLRDERTREDPLDSFLSRDQPTAQEKLNSSQANVKEIAARLRSAAELPAKAAPEADDIMTGTFATEPAAVAVAAPMPVIPAPAPMVDAPVSSLINQASGEVAVAEVPREPTAGAGEVIPFPHERTRREAPVDPAPIPTLQPPASAVEAAPASASQVRAPEPDVVTPAPVIPAPVPIVPAPVAAPARESVASAAATSGVYRLLAVDDDAQVTRFIENALRDKVSELVVADTVQEAVAIVERNPRGLIVASDLIIARSDGRGILGGIEILERVKKVAPALPVLLFTDYQNEEAEAKARALGVVAVLKKPRKAQVQSAGKDGGQNPMAEFLTALEAAVLPLLSAPPAEPAPAPVVPAPAPTPVEVPPAASLPAHAPAVKPLTPEAPTAPEVLPSPRAYDLGREIAGELEELAGPLEEDLPPEVLSGGEMATLRSMLAELIDPSNRDTITLLVLRFASHLVERAGLFLATRRAFVGLGGFSQDESSDNFVVRVRRIQIPVDHDSVFSRVARYRAVIRGGVKETDGNKRLFDGLGGEWPKESIAAPLISGDRVAAILYGDNPSGKPLGPIDSLEIFLQQAGLAMDRALLERKLEDSKKKQGGAE